MIREATIEDAFALAPRLRAADRAELEAQGHLDMDVVLAESIAVSTPPLAFEVAGEVHALFGCAPGPGYGIPWLLGSEALFSVSNQKALLALPFEHVPQWLDQYGVLLNMVHTENDKSIRWLKRIGFTIEPAVQIEGGAFFHPFTMRKQPVCAGP